MAMDHASSFRNGVYVPQMPWFEPSNEPSAKASMLSQTVSEGDHFSFPADRDFWNNFVTQVRLYPGAMDAPHFHVDASHTDERVLVNQEFLRRFVSGWERANPHVVKVTTPQGSTTFHASEEFWNRFCTIAGQRSRERQARGDTAAEDTVVRSSLFPGAAPVKTTARDWQEICQSWEQEQGITPGEKQRQMQQRWQQIDGGPGSAARSSPAEPSPLPAPGPSPEMLSQRRELQQCDAELEAQRRQLELSQQQLAAAREQLDAANQRSVQAGADLQRARGEAERYRQEVEQLRAGQQQMQQGWEQERAAMEGRVRRMEAMLAELQSDVGRQREQSLREVQAREQELAAARQVADMADLKKELQLRELMQEEILRAREEAQREAAERARHEQLSRTQQELDEMRSLLRDQPLLANPCGPCAPWAPWTQPSSVSQGQGTVPGAGLGAVPPQLQPQQMVQPTSGFPRYPLCTMQRTVATQTPAAAARDPCTDRGAGAPLTPRFPAAGRPVHAPPGRWAG